MARRRGPKIGDTLGALSRKIEAVRFVCRCGHAGETTIAALLMRNAWNTPLADAATRARCTACGQRGVEAKPVFGDMLAAG